MEVYRALAAPTPRSQRTMPRMPGWGRLLAAPLAPLRLSRALPRVPPIAVSQIAAGLADHRGLLLMRRKLTPLVCGPSQTRREPCCRTRDRRCRAWGRAPRSVTAGEAKPLL